MHPLQRATSPLLWFLQLCVLGLLDRAFRVFVQLRLVRLCSCADTFWQTEDPRLRGVSAFGFFEGVKRLTCPSVPFDLGTSGNWICASTTSRRNGTPSSSSRYSMRWVSWTSCRESPPRPISPSLDAASEWSSAGAREGAASAPPDAEPSDSVSSSSWSRVSLLLVSACSSNCRGSHQFMLKRKGKPSPNTPYHPARQTPACRPSFRPRPLVPLRHSPSGPLPGLACSRCRT